MRSIGWLYGSVVLLTPVFASAASYVVAPGGDDGNTGDAGSPWATLQHAADMVAPGDTVTVEPGDYKGFNAYKTGTQDAPITFSAKPGVNITSENSQTDLDGINIEDTDNQMLIEYVTVEGFSVHGMARAGIRTARSAHITLRKNKSDENQQFGILTGNSDDLLLEENECSRSVVYHGIEVSQSSDRVVIRRNLVWGNHVNGIHINGGTNQGFDGVSSHALVEANIVYDNTLGEGSAINCDGVQDSLFQNNLIFDTHCYGLSLYRIDGAEPSKNNVVINNTVLVASDGRWAINIQNGSTGNHIKNNILWNTHPTRGAISTTTANLPDLVSDHNLMIDRFTLDGGKTLMTLGEWQTATAQDASSSVADPQFLDVAADDYHLLPGSPAVDNGTDSEAPTSDLDGVARPQGAAFDVGAYELCPDGDCQSGAGGAGAGGSTGGAGAGGATTATGGHAGSCDPGVGDCPPGAGSGGCDCRISSAGASQASRLSLFAACLIAALWRRRRHRSSTSD